MADWSSLQTHRSRQHHQADRHAGSHLPCNLLGAGRALQLMGNDIGHLSCARAELRPARQVWARPLAGHRQETMQVRQPGACTTGFSACTPPSHLQLLCVSRLPESFLSAALCSRAPGMANPTELALERLPHYKAAVRSLACTTVYLAVCALHAHTSKASGHWYIHGVRPHAELKSTVRISSKVSLLKSYLTPGIKETS